MKYYLIVGEASGDLHASRLMKAIKREDPEAQFRFFGGDMMSSVGGERVRHYRELAYMGFIPVLLHLRTILGNMAWCKKDIMQWQPDALILVDYPGFNLKIARYIHANSDIPVCYYISPKIWAWKEWRIKDIRRDVDHMFSILPFEIDFYEKKHRYPICYVGNPTAEEVRQYRETHNETFASFASRHGLSSKPVIALLAGSRKQEIKDNLPAMIAAASRRGDCQLVLAGAPGIERDYYTRFVAGKGVTVVYDDTYALLSHARAAVVTSGTATLETALFGVPQVVCYETPLHTIVSALRKRLLSVQHVSLVNLIAGEEVVKELVAEKFSADNIHAELVRLLDDEDYRARMCDGYDRVWSLIGDSRPSERAAREIVEILSRR